MQVIDLTHTISEDMPVFPGTMPPVISLTNTYQKDGFKESCINMVTHTGTHMDPPVHVLPNQPTIDGLDVKHFVGPGIVIDVSNKSEGDSITIDDILPYREATDNADFLLFYTGWDSYWGKSEYFGDYPAVDDSVISYINDTRKKGIGVDVIGLDPVVDKMLVHHRQLFCNGDKVIIENLTNLDRLIGKDFIFIALPLKIKNGDGSPVRAVAVIQ